MNPKAEAYALDQEAEQLAARMQSTFIRIGKVMAAISECDKWRLLTDPRTGSEYSSLESWVGMRFRSQRATAFAARKLYRQLHPFVPDAVLESSEPGALKVLAKLPESAQRNPEMHELAMNSTTGEFTQEALERYPNELIEEIVTWQLKPTMSQAAMYDRVLEKVQKAYGDVGSVLSREDALEALLSDFDQQSQDTLSEASKAPESDWTVQHG